MSEIYFVYRRITYEDGNMTNITNNFMGCFNKYKSAKRLVKKFIANTDDWVIVKDMSTFEPKLCDCCGEIKAYVNNDLYSGEQISIYKCIPH